MTKDKIWHLTARKLSREASPEELKELELLQQEDSLLHFELLMVEQYWNAETEPDTDYLEATYLLHYSKMKKLGIDPAVISEKHPENSFHKSSGLFGSKFILLSLLLILLGSASYFLLKQPHKESALAKKEETKIPVTGVAETPKATKIKMILPDGSTVWLNSSSKLSYENMMKNRDKREVTLTGEAYFDVVRNPERPFIIHTSSVDVKVLGTEFNVKAYPDDATVETSLVHGSVQVFLKNNPEKFYLLKPNEKLILYKPGEVLNTTNANSSNLKSFGSVPKIVVEKMNFIEGTTTSTETAWINNRLIFHEESFNEVAVKLERWFNVEFEFQNNHLELERLTGTLPSESLQKALDAWKFTTPEFNYRIDNNKVIIY